MNEGRTQFELRQSQPSMPAVNEINAPVMVNVGPNAEGQSEGVVAPPAYDQSASSQAWSVYGYPQGYAIGEPAPVLVADPVPPPPTKRSSSSSAILWCIGGVCLFLILSGIVGGVIKAGRSSRSSSHSPRYRHPRSYHSTPTPTPTPHSYYSSHWPSQSSFYFVPSYSNSNLSPRNTVMNPVSENNAIANRLTDIQNYFYRRTMSLNIDRARFNFYPGYIFHEYRNPLIFERVNFNEESGADAAGLTNDFFSQALDFYVREDEGIRLMGENGVIGIGKNQTKIRDLTRFSIMCLAKESRNVEDRGTYTLPTCPLSSKVFSPYNIWLSMVDEDQNTDEYDGWKQKTIGTEMLNGRSGFDGYPNRDAGVKPYYVEMGLAEEDDEENYTVRDFINDQTSNMTSIVREVLEEYGMLTVVREAYRDGTLMQELNELWKPEWDKDSGQSLKHKVEELVRGSNRRSFRVFNDWVQEQSDDGDSLKNLWKHWSGVRVLTEDKLNRAVLVEQRSNDDNEASNFIRSHTCAVQLDIPSSLNENNIENVMRVSLQSSGYGSV